MLTNSRSTDPSESAAAYDPEHAKAAVAAVSWIYTLGPASDEEIVRRYYEHIEFHHEWPWCDPESVRKRCSDARRLDRRIQKVGTTTSSHGKTVGVYGFVEVAA